jgi:hypothetical protein
MRKIRSLPASLVALAALAVLLLWPSTAQAATQVDQYRFQGNTAVASFYSTAGCISAGAYLSATEDRSNPSQSTAYIFAYRNDECAGVQTHAVVGSATLPPGAFTIDSRLTTASLVTSIPVDDHITGVSGTVTANLSWAGFGELSSQRYTSQTRTPSYLLTQTYSGTFRDSSVTGSLSDGTFEYAGTEAASSGQLSLTKSGQVTLYRM